VSLGATIGHASFARKEKDMEDKEVGEMLRRVNTDELWTSDHKYIRYDYRRLIHKIVEERAARSKVTEETALDDFGIFRWEWKMELKP